MDEDATSEPACRQLQTAQLLDGGEVVRSMAHVPLGWPSEGG